VTVLTGTPLLRRGQLDARPPRLRRHRPREGISLVPRPYLPPACVPGPGTPRGV